MSDTLECVRVEIAKLELNPGDVLVFHHPGRVSEVEIKHLREAMETVCPGHKGMILEGGMSLAVLTREQLKERMGEP